MKKMNKTNKFLTSLAMLCSAAVFTVALADDPVTGESELGNSILCYCQKGLFSNNRCLVSNNSSVCAQSEPGGNISCQDYNSNCH